MNFINNLMEMLVRHPKRIVFTDGDDLETMRAAAEFARLRLGAPILLGKKFRIREIAAAHSIDLGRVRIIDPELSEDLEIYVKRLETISRYKGIRVEEARKMIINPNYFGAMMVQYSYADAIVGGAHVTTGIFLRPLQSLIKPLPGISSLSSCVVLEVPGSAYGDHGIIYMADCGINPEPNVQELAEIGIETAKLARQLSGKIPRVAYLGFSTKGSVKHRITEKMIAAAALCEQLAGEIPLELEVEGELQVDAALIPEMGKAKAQGSLVAGQANVLIFPDLNAGNIALKLLTTLTPFEVYGNIILGLDRPAADIPRGADARDILGAAIIVGIRAVEFHTLHPDWYTT
ncbi:MAG: phosphate acyltransferase [Verrucomicrobiae bacterium]|nr:phosphate acyltransferase [Verrucomicrobiae bacterium]